MSQNSDTENQDLNPEDELDSGFDFEAGNDDAAGDKGQPVDGGNEADDAGKHEDVPFDSADSAQSGEDGSQAQPEESHLTETDTRPEPENVQPPQAARKLAEVPQNLAAEIEELRKLNPQAAEIALEDTPDGESIRRRLETHGADIALDRAEMLLDSRARSERQYHEQQARIDAHNRRFRETIQRQNPEYYALISDPGRRAEADRYCRKVMEWIESKPFREARGLMEIARHGRDANQICQLISRFESETRDNGRQPDYTGALAVPGRGATTAPTGIGDKDDFDAGWDLNRDK